MAEAAVPPPLARPERGWATTIAATLLLALFWWMAVSASFEWSPTSDELPHIAAGFAYDHYGDFRQQPENGVLPQRLFGLPAIASHAQMAIDPSLWTHSTYWQVAWDFFYGNGNPIDRIVLQARALNALFGVALGGLIFAFARSWYGARGALMTLAFYAFTPVFLAHSALATSDLAGTTGLTIAPWLFWRHLARRDLASGALAGLGSGLALASKFNGVLLGPIYFLLLLADLGLRAPAGPPGWSRRFAVNLGLAAGQAAAAVAILWLFFDCRFAARGPGTPEFAGFARAWGEMRPYLGWKYPLLQWIDRAHMLPQAWTYGLANVLAGTAERAAYFAGEHRLQGWWQFFPTLFLVKNPLGLLGAFFLAGGLGAWRLSQADWAERQAVCARALPFALTALVVGGTAVAGHLNVGDRHILPVYPSLFLLIGVLASHRAGILAAALLFAAEVAASTGIRPHYLAFFNSALGGPGEAYRLVADSSLDWGQSLPTLRRWLASERRPGEKFYLGYFGSAWPPHYGVRPDYFLPTSTYVVRPPLVPYALEPGLYAVSATVLDENYSPFLGPWRPAWEEAYERLRPAAAKPGAGPPPEYELYDRLRFARLCKYLQARRPDATAGYAILIYRLGAAELHAAQDGPVVGTHRVRMP